jgi:hypothetical protein
LHYACQFCGKVFDKGSRLGGHLAKVHPGQSKSYQKKMAIREKKKESREIAKKVNAFFAEKTNENPNNHR